MGKAATKSSARKSSSSKAGKPAASSNGRAQLRPREVAAELLKQRGGEIAVRELAELTVKDRRVKGRLHGKTPAATVAAQIYVAAAKGELFEKAGRGTVRLSKAAA